MVIRHWWGTALLAGGSLISSAPAAAQGGSGADASTSPPASLRQLTIYNENFAVVKERRPFDLQAGMNEVRVTDVTAHLEPDSVVVRGAGNGGNGLRVIEQNYESDPLSEGLMLMKSEGKVISFEVAGPQPGQKEIKPGKIIRSGYVPHVSQFEVFGSGYAARQMAGASPSGGGQPIVEMDGKVRFGLPGVPMFEGLDPNAYLKPTLQWLLWTDRAGRREVDFSYLTGGMKWGATYNVVVPEAGDRFALTGWVTISNQSGADFRDVSVKLMAGDVARAPQEIETRAYRYAAKDALYAQAEAPQQATERSFDEYHLYDLNRTTTLQDREIKQVEFARGENVPSRRIYVYKGFLPPSPYAASSVQQDRSYGTVSNSKVAVKLEFDNATTAGLGIPLPRGEVKVYRRDRDGRDEFIGEDRIDHTPRGEKVRLHLGNTFDLVGERKQTNFQIDTSRSEIFESFEIKVRNRKREMAEVRVVEPLYRWHSWNIVNSSHGYEKKDAHTIEYRVRLEPDQEETIRYTVHYTW